MATVHYLNWDKEHEESLNFFHQATISERSELDTVPKDWYREVATVPDIGNESIWTAFQRGVDVDPDDGDISAARESLQNAKDRSMCVGDVIERDDGVYIVASRGFASIAWGDIPTIMEDDTSE